MRNMFNQVRIVIAASAVGLCGAAFIPVANAADVSNTPSVGPLAQSGSNGTTKGSGADPYGSNPSSVRPGPGTAGSAGGSVPNTPSAADGASTSGSTGSATGSATASGNSGAGKGTASDPYGSNPPSVRPGPGTAGSAGGSLPNTPSAAEGGNATGAAGAMKSQGDASSSFTRLDSNGDGMIDRQEASRSPSLAKAFERADSNQDKMLDKTEFNSAMSSAHRR